MRSMYNNGNITLCTGTVLVLLQSDSRDTQPVAEIMNCEKPFASLPNFVGKECKRVLINRERVGNFKFNDPTNKTDVFYKVR